MYFLTNTSGGDRETSQLSRRSTITLSGSIVRPGETIQFTEPTTEIIEAMMSNQVSVSNGKQFIDAQGFTGYTITAVAREEKLETIDGIRTRNFTEYVIEASDKPLTAKQAKALEDDAPKADATAPDAEAYAEAEAHREAQAEQAEQEQKANPGETPADAAEALNEDGGDVSPDAETATEEAAPAPEAPAEDFFEEDEEGSELSDASFLATDFKAAEAVEKIENGEVEDMDAFLEGETRKSVLMAAAKSKL